MGGGGIQWIAFDSTEEKQRKSACGGGVYCLWERRSKVIKAKVGRNKKETGIRQKKRGARFGGQVEGKGVSHNGDKYAVRERR